MRLKPVLHAEKRDIDENRNQPPHRRNDRHPAHHHRPDERVRQRILHLVGIQLRAQSAEEEARDGEQEPERRLAGHDAEDQHRPIPALDDSLSQRIPHEHENRPEQHQQVEHRRTEHLPHLPHGIRAHAQHDPLHQHHPHDPAAPGPALRTAPHGRRQRFVEDRHQQHRHQPQGHKSPETQDADRLRHVEETEKRVHDRMPEKRERGLRRVETGRHGHVLPCARRQPGIPPEP